MDTDRLELLAQIAVWYYEEKLSQEAIAQKVGRSLSSISRMLQEARDLDLVEIRVRYPLQSDSELESRLCQTFGLAEAAVLTNSPLDQDGRLMRRIGELGSRFVLKYLHDGVKIGLAWGTTIHEVVCAMPDAWLSEALVVQISGSVGSGDPTGDGAEMVRSLAQKLNSPSRFLHAPLFVESESFANALMRDQANMATLAIAGQLDVALVGAGTTDPVSSGLRRAGYLDEDDLRSLQELGAVGDLIGYHLDADGNILDVSVNRRVVGISVETLRTIPNVIVVAAGANKVRPILAILRGHHVTALVTDAATARAVLELQGAGR